MDNNKQQLQDERKQKLRYMSMKLFGDKVQVTHFVKYLANPPQYALLTNRGEISLGDCETLLSYNKAAARMSEAFNLVIPLFTRKDWNSFVGIMLEAVEELPGGMLPLLEVRGTVYGCRPESAGMHSATHPLPRAEEIALELQTRVSRNAQCNWKRPA